MDGRIPVHSARATTCGSARSGSNGAGSAGSDGSGSDRAGSDWARISHAQGRQAEQGHRSQKERASKTPKHCVVHRVPFGMPITIFAYLMNIVGKPTERYGRNQSRACLRPIRHSDKMGSCGWVSASGVQASALDEIRS